MKKILMLAACALLSFGFYSCSDETDDGGSAKLKTISAEVEAESKQRSAAYSEDVTVDLSENPLKDDVVSSLKAGDDVTDFFTQSKVGAERAAVASDDGLEGFKAVLKSVTKVKLEVTITATTPDEDCSILISAVISAEKTDSGNAAVALVKQVNVGEALGSVASGTLSLSGGSTPKASDMAGLILKFRENDDDDDSIKYYKFGSDGTVITKYKYSYGYLDESSTKYTYDEKTGEIKEDDEDDEDEDSFSTIDSALDGKDYLIKVGDSYYIYNSMKLTRSSGKDLDSTFTYSTSVSEKQTMDMGDSTMTLGTVKGTIDYAMTTTSAGTFTAKMTAKVAFSYSSEYKKLAEQYGIPLENAGALSYSSDMVGVYTNNDGVITAKGKMISTDSSTGETEVEEFENGTAFYDGTHIYFGDTLSLVTETEMNEGK